MDKEKEGTADIRHGLWQLLTRTRHVIFKARQKELRRYGISTRASAVLFIALRYDKVTPSLISQQLVLEHHSVSELLKRMEKEGLIKRVKDLERKNLVRIEVTNKGREAYHLSAERESTKEIMSVLTHDEQFELWHILYKLRKKAIQYLGLENLERYPPEDPEDL